MARLPPNHPSKRRNRNRGGQNDIGADSSLSNESNSSSFFSSNSSRGRTESVPTLNVSGTVTPPASVELERDRTPIRTPNLPGGCSGTISTPTGSRNATTAPRIPRPRENAVRCRCLALLNLAATPTARAQVRVMTSLFLLGCKIFLQDKSNLMCAICDDDLVHVSFCAHFHAIRDWLCVIRGDEKDKWWKTLKGVVNSKKVVAGCLWLIV